ncbi:MAG TPA: Gfo/Idh/MocA family oxidoreductase [Gaiellaceae bacterium]|nr:Gfo/Idh/MocA family oxidoreductase [Gaiellaceae bacterium]
MLRAGVVGAGSMGGNHARVYAALTGGCELAGVYDLDPERARAVARRWGGRAYATLEELLDAVDVVSIASPTSCHFEHVRDALARGVHVLVEKPAAATAGEALRLLELARTAPGRPVVQVGHIEEFNPAVAEARKLLADEELIGISAQRLSPFDGRIQDVDVVQDLMLHDVHVALSLVGAQPTAVRAAGRSVHGAGTDYAAATLVFGDATVVSLSASRVTQEKVRTLSATTRRAYVTVDYLQRTIAASRWTNLSVDVGDGRAYRQESVVERVFVPIEEPLVAEIAAFLGCVRTGTPPRVTLETAIGCLQVVDRIRHEIARDARVEAAVAA